MDLSSCVIRLFYIRDIELARIRRTPECTQGGQQAGGKLNVVEISHFICNTRELVSRVSPSAYVLVNN